MAILKAFHGKPSIRVAVLKQLRAHQKADEIVKGKYWENGKGCAVGCTIYSSNHAEYVTRFGIPEVLAQLEDTIFEGLPNHRAKSWPVEFMAAISPGADLSRVGWKFLHYLLTDETVNPGIVHPFVRGSVAQCVAILVPLTKGLPVDESAAWSARSAAESAALSAESTLYDESAALSAESAALSAESALYDESAALSTESAWCTARSAEFAALSARSAARSVGFAESAESAWCTARSAAYEKMADKLLGLLKEV